MHYSIKILLTALVTLVVAGLLEVAGDGQASDSLEKKLAAVVGMSSIVAIIVALLLRIWTL
jgi:hypothetical protein